MAPLREALRKFVHPAGSGTPLSTPSMAIRVPGTDMKEAARRPPLVGIVAGVMLFAPLLARRAYIQPHGLASHSGQATRRRDMDPDIRVMGSVL